MKQHSKRHLKLRPRLCTLYTSPSSTTTLPVYEQLSITWNPACLTPAPSTIDLYLSVRDPASISGLTAVHEWTGVPFSNGLLATQLQPGWWNASTGAGSVQAQFIMSPSGSPLWDSTAPAGPLFTITYNGTYPASVTAPAIAPTYTGPSVESVASPTSSSHGGAIAAGVVVPLLVIGALVAGYVAWKRYKKRPEKKRWSAVIDKRMSMISQGTWQPPRPSTSSRPGSHYIPDSSSPRRPSATHTRPSASLHSSSAARTSHFFADGRPQSAYSQIGLAGAGPSPLRSGFARTPAPTNGNGTEMRQVGAGERASRVSFVSGGGSGERPSFSSGTRPPHASIYGNRASVHGAQLSPSHASQRSADSSSVSLLQTSPSPSFSTGPHGLQSGMPPSLSTREELSASALGPQSPTPVGSRRQQQQQQQQDRTSVAESLRMDLSNFPALAVVRDGALAFAPNSPRVDEDDDDDEDPDKASPFEDPDIVKAPAVMNPNAHMPMAARDSLLSPDQALLRYAVVHRDAVSPPPPPSSPSKPAAARAPLTRSASSFLTAAPGRIMRSFRSNGALKTSAETPVELARAEGMRAKSPFEDPPRVGGEVEEEEKGEEEHDAAVQQATLRASVAPTEASRYSTQSVMGVAK